MHRKQSAHVREETRRKGARWQAAATATTALALLVLSPTLRQHASTRNTHARIFDASYHRHETDSFPSLD